MKKVAEEPSRESTVAHVVRRNMRALVAAHERAEKNKSISERVSDVICAFSGSTTFAYFEVSLIQIFHTATSKTCHPCI